MGLVVEMALWKETRLAVDEGLFAMRLGSDGIVYAQGGSLLVEQ